MSPCPLAKSFRNFRDGLVADRKPSLVCVAEKLSIESRGSVCSRVLGGLQKGGVMKGVCGGAAPPSVSSVRRMKKKGGNLREVSIMGRHSGPATLSNLPLGENLQNRVI